MAYSKNTTMTKIGILISIGTFVCMSAACPLEYDPVCGNDGNTYPSECYFNLEKRKNATLEIKSKGICFEWDNLDKTFSIQDGPLQINITGDDISIVDLSDNSTSVESSEESDEIKTTKLKAKSAADDGESKDSNTNIDKTQAKVRNVRAIFNNRNNKHMCPCPRNLLEVCGSDGVTYSNPCLLDCAAKSNKKIRLHHNGPCGRNARKVREVSKESLLTQEIPYFLIVQEVADEKPTERLTHEGKRIAESEGKGNKFNDQKDSQTEYVIDEELQDTQIQGKIRKVRDVQNKQNFWGKGRPLNIIEAAGGSQYKKKQRRVRNLLNKDHNYSYAAGPKEEKSRKTREALKESRKPNCYMQPCSNSTNIFNR